MSAQHGEGSEGESQGLVRTPKQLITVVVLSFIVPVIGIVMLVWFVTGGKNLEPAGSSARAAESISDRMRPVGALWIAGETPPAGAAAAAAPAATVVAAAPAAAAAAPAGSVDGEDVYKKACAACHASGAAGAPKSGDKAAWAPRLKKGEDALVASVIKGLGIMPPRGGNPALTDAQIRAAVAYQIKTNR
jgi:cytochrome c5